MVQNEKRNKYTHLHKKIKHQAKIFRKKYDIERALEMKEKEAADHCNIFRDNYDDRCFDLFEEIEQLEHQLKTVQKKLGNTMTNY